VRQRHATRGLRPGRRLKRRTPALVGVAGAAALQARLLTVVQASPARGRRCSLFVAAWPSSGAAGRAPRRPWASRTGHARPSARLGGQRLAVIELTRPGADARLAGRHDLGPGSGRGDRLAGPSAAPSPASDQPPDASARRDRGDRQGPPAPTSAWISWPSETVGDDNHWKISVVQSPPWRRTSWARAGPSGRAWKSTKKSGSTSIPPSGWQFTFRSQERSSG
jgi:hypothetical protein